MISTIHVPPERTFTALELRRTLSARITALRDQLVAEHPTEQKQIGDLLEQIGNATKSDARVARRAAYKANGSK